MAIMETWAGLGSALGSVIFLYSLLGKYFPYHIDAYVRRHTRRLFAAVYPYVQITVSEYRGEWMKRSEAYAAIESYLASSCSQHANKLKADFGKDSTNLTLSMDVHEEVTDEFEGVKLWWSSHSTTRSAPSPWSPAPEERRSYKLTFHKSQRDLVVSRYIDHVMAEGKAVTVRNRQRKLFTNNPSSKWDGYRSKVWNHVLFEHPASFDTVAMEPGKRKEILDDLDTFRRGKEYYANVGKAWKRGYLLYGPPGTGKSTTVAAMANHMDYDIYDLELTTVKTNSDLRRLLIETTSKSIILIEDIDCSLELTGKRRQKSKKEEEESEEKKLPGEEKDESSRVTLSGLLNFIDGLWSASAGERLVVFTTNHIEKLDPALIRRGRMDKHIEMSYCSFEAFKVLAKNYLAISSHRTFETIRGLMEEVNITPADVAENLMPKSVDDHDHDAETCLESLIQALNVAKEEAASKAAAGEAIAGKEDKGTNVGESN
ncbi:AAA-ATPase ASD, mitochondrial-like [Iris pallida]|uniref:AAA-ATPase ASD, mitochondrial-like n=1 Tax=Iris pallida TaxID=29817 RepID=A0AAX6G2W2_IRIPA|nr:AAA-ATPase ASD, mitochondrial-like [Iris pallida]